MTETTAIRTTMFAMIVIAGLLAGAIFVLGDPVPPKDLTDEGDSRRNLSDLADESVDAEAGNVTELTIEALSVTKYWQGFYGNITGTITLDDANNNTLYNWSETSPSGQVYATRSNTIDFSNDIDCASQAEIASEATNIGQSGTESDHITATFDAQSHPAFTVGTADITGNTCNSTNTFVSDGDQSTDFYEVLLADGAGVFVYTAIIDADTTGFDSGTYDFQMLVGENGSDGTTTPYYFYVELN